MRPSILLLVVLPLFLLAGSCKGNYMSRTSELAEPDDSTAIVRFQRPDENGRLVRIMFDRKLIGNLKPQTQFDYIAAPGAHLITCVGDKVWYMEANLVAGKTYFVRVSHEDRSRQDDFMMVPVKPGTFFATEAKELTRNLSRYSPNLSKLEYWASGNRAKLDWIYDNYAKDAKSRKAWPVLQADYGR